MFGQIVTMFHNEICSNLYQNCFICWFLSCPAAAVFFCLQDSTEYDKDKYFLNKKCCAKPDSHFRFIDKNTLKRDPAPPPGPPPLPPLQKKYIFTQYKNEIIDRVFKGRNYQISPMLIVRIKIFFWRQKNFRKKTLSV